MIYRIVYDSGHVTAGSNPAVTNYGSSHAKEVHKDVQDTQSVPKWHPMDQKKPLKRWPEPRVSRYTWFSLGSMAAFCADPIQTDKGSSIRSLLGAQMLPESLTRGVPTQVYVIHMFFWRFYLNAAPLVKAVKRLLSAKARKRASHLGQRWTTSQFDHTLLQVNFDDSSI